MGAFPELLHGRSRPKRQLCCLHMKMRGISCASGIACRYYMDLDAQDVRAIVERHTRLTNEDIAELMAASTAPQGVPRPAPLHACIILQQGRRLATQLCSA